LVFLSADDHCLDALAERRDEIGGIQPGGLRRVSKAYSSFGRCGHWYRRSSNLRATLEALKGCMIEDRCNEVNTPRG
jgi:hypothetical protein